MIPWKSPHRIVLEPPIAVPLLAAEASACAGPFVQADDPIPAGECGGVSQRHDGEQPPGEGLLQRLREAGL